MTKVMRRLLIGSASFLVTTAAVIGGAAPTPGDASLTVDKQIHLGTDSALVKQGSLLLWEDGTNTGFGRSALSSNTTGSSNTAIGSSALTSNTTGMFNTAVGDIALQSNYDGERNTAVGGFALTNNVAGSFNTAIGLAALEYNTSGNSNTAVGIGALGANIGEETNPQEGSANTAVGASALGSNEYGFNNTAIGYSAMEGAAGGNWNTAVGAETLLFNTSGDFNTVVGSAAMRYNSTGSTNTAVGLDALHHAYSGNENVALGGGALYNNSSGNNNIAVGNLAGSNLGYGVTTPSTSMSDNIFIGNEGETDEEQVIRIGSGQNKTFISGIAGAAGGTFVVDVCIDGLTRQLGPCAVSSLRFKEEVRDLGDLSTRLLSLRPVAFRYREEVRAEPRPVEFGLIAEEVAQVFPELVVHDGEGRPETVKYHLLSSLLLNELQKQAMEIQRMKARLQRLEAAEPRYQRTALRGPP